MSDTPTFSTDCESALACRAEQTYRRSRTRPGRPIRPGATSRAVDDATSSGSPGAAMSSQPELQRKVRQLDNDVNEIYLMLNQIQVCLLYTSRCV